MSLLEERERELYEREKAVRADEMELKASQEVLDRRESELDKRKDALDEREDSLDMRVIDLPTARAVFLERLAMLPEHGATEELIALYLGAKKCHPRAVEKLVKKLSGRA